MRIWGTLCLALAACGSPSVTPDDMTPAACTLERERDPDTMLCKPKAGQLCGPCGDECTAAGGSCRDNACATACDDTKIFCPRGYRCDKKACIPSLLPGCEGCYEDADCGAGQACNVNNKRCVPEPTGPDAQLEMLALDFRFDDMGTPKKSRNLTWSMGFYSRRDASFNPWSLKPGECASLRSTLTENAPFPIGPLKDAGTTLTLMLPTKSIPFSREQDDNPNFGFSYSPSMIKVEDFTAGAVSWTGTGGAMVGAFNAAGTIPADFTTSPDLLAAPAVTMSAAAGVTVTFDPPGGGWLEISWNEASGNTVTALTRLACRAAAGSSSVTLPAAMLTQVPRNSAVSLLATRADVIAFTTTGVAQGQVVFGVQKAGGLILTP
jgi:hypothetical protein